tara:strand:- start:1883 stop:2035 length:153 start_codon:yes stop_codon:yes gene_type:complete
METSAVQSAKLVIVAITGLSKDALHVNTFFWPTVLLVVARSTGVFAQTTK